MQSIIDTSYTVNCLDNKLIKNFWKKYENQQDLIWPYLSSQSISQMINENCHKIKLVKNLKYQKHIVYEYKLNINHDFKVRLAYCLDHQQHQIIILALVALDKTLTKAKFDHLVSQCLTYENH